VNCTPTTAPGYDVAVGGEPYKRLQVAEDRIADGKAKTSPR